MENNTNENSKYPDMGDNKLAYEQGWRKFLIKKYIIETCLLTIILFALYCFSCCGLITGCTTGTLLGAVIGYFASSIRKIHE